MKHIYTLLLASALLISHQAFSQASACPAVNAGPDQTICSGQCVNMTATVQGSVQTTSYTVSTIPYSPYSYTTGTAVLINIDDTWSPAINLPFCFSFFGTTYNQFVIGSNGLISFNTAYANGYCQWPIGAAIPSTSDPLASIMCPWHDIDPSIGSSSDVRYQVYGTAPCREMVVSWYQVPMFSSSCNSLIATQQLVLHETTNIIDMYILNKPLCTSWNGGYAIEGIQDMSGTLAAVVPGRNYPTTWTASNDGKRFMPAGTPNYSIQWTGPSGVIGTTATVNVCPTTTTTYTCTVTNTTCASPIVVSDQITINVTPGITVSSVPGNISCYGNCNGTASASIVSGAGPYTWDWLPGTPTGDGTANVSNLCAGTYTVNVTGAGGCTGTQVVTVTQPPQVTASSTPTNVTCNGACNGSISVVAGGGTGAYTYTWSPSASGPNPTGLCPGSYTLTVRDVNLCAVTQTITITQPPVLTASASSTPATCATANGTATATPGGGTPGYTYAWAPLGGSAATATGLSPGTYTCTITDARGCTTTVTTTVGGSGSITASVPATSNVSCFGGNNGSATASGSGGSGTYTYAWAPSGGSSATATNLTAGNYTVTVTDGFGCIATSTIAITQPAQVTAAIASSNNVSCFGGTNGGASATGGGGVGSYTYSWSPSGGSSASTIPVGAGNYTVTVTDGNGCPATATVAITQPALLTAAVPTSSPVLCNGGNTGSATASGAGGTGTYNYAWTPSGGNAATASNLTSGNYTVTVTDANGCTASSTIAITQPTALTASTSTTPSTCGNPNGTASATPAGGSPGYSYSWSSGGNAATATGLGVGSYTVTITDNNGCTTSAIASVLNQGSPTVTMNSFTNVTCFGAADGTASSTGSGGTGTLTYAWTPSGGSAATATNLAPNNYTITVTDQNGCTSQATVAITEPPQLTVTAVSQTDVACFGGATGDASVTAAGGTGSYTYAWTPSGGSGSTASSLVAGTYTCSITDANGCNTTSSFTITEPPQLTIAAAGFDATCFGACDGQVVVIPGGGTQPFSYLWNSGCSNPSCNSMCAGTYSITVTDAHGCTIQSTATVNEPTAVQLVTSSVDAHCNQPDGQADVLANGGTPGYTYSWSSGGSNATETGLIPGSYTVTVTDANGCTSQTTAIVNNLPGITASLQSSQDVSCNTLCDGVATVTVSGGNTPYTYAWNTGGTTASEPNLCAGTYTCSITDAFGCTGTVTVTITQPSALTITPSAAVSVCSGNPASISATAAGGTAAYTIVWNPGNLSGGSQTVTPLSTTTYTVTVTDANGCTATGTQAVNIDPNPVASLSADVTSGCSPVCVNFTDLSAVSAGNISSWSWDFGDNTTSTQQSPSHCYATAGSYDVSILVTTGAGCTHTILMPGYINVYPNPVAGFSSSPGNATIANPSISFADSSNGATQWFWNFGDINNSSSTNQNPVFLYPDSGSYIVTQVVVNQYGCADTTSDVVHIGGDYIIYVPNAFTPDENGLNDVFMPVMAGVDPEKFEMWIFDRWGNIIYYTDDINKGWDGKVQQGRSDSYVQIDTYVWKIKLIDFRGDKHNMLGKVSVIR